MVERLPGLAPPIRKSNPNSYADTPFTDEITLIEMPMKFSFPSIKAYDGTPDPDDHVAQYRQRMLAVALPKGSREATMCKGDKLVEQFASSRDVEKTSVSLYKILQHQAEPLRGYIARFNQEKVAIPECSIPTAISAFKRGMLPDRDIYKELTKYQCKTMEPVLPRAWAQVKWEEVVATRAKAQCKQDPKTIRPDRAERDEKPSQRPARDSRNWNHVRYQNRPIEKAEGMEVSTWPDISHLSVSRLELINVLRHMGQQDCVALKIEVNELLKKGHLREFLSEKAKSHLSKETTGKPTEAAPVSPARQDRVIHVISGGSEISGISHAAAKKSTWNRGSQAITPAPRNRRNKLDVQGAGESSHPASRPPCNIAHRSELPGKKDTGR
ncbi:hypothetical protein F2Q70_00017376 [Brassica cretica]|uniref:Retrotransposon gag domain-containing protein n=1 Tax=Brassica cretica TaxID=69181 RepID=A0A8S9HSI8_BRACR|nr:hypothetical protein F2Q70_00017376 [Brassica cretica]